MSARALRQITGEQIARVISARGHLFFFSFWDYIRRWLIESRWRSHRNTGDDVNKFSPSGRVRSLARCDGRLRRHWNGTEKRRRFMLPRTLPAMIIGAFISAILSSRRFLPFLSLILVSNLYFSLFKIISVWDSYFQVKVWNIFMKY